MTTAGTSATSPGLRPVSGPLKRLAFGQNSPKRPFHVAMTARGEISGLNSIQYVFRHILPKP